MDLANIYSSLGIKNKGKTILNYNKIEGIKIYKEDLEQFNQYLLRLNLPKNNSELKSLAKKLELIKAAIVTISAIKYLDQSVGYNNSKNYKELSRLYNKIQSRYSEIMQEISANINNYDVRGMSRFLISQKHFSKYVAKNIHTRKMIIKLEEELIKQSEIYHEFDKEFDYGKIDGKTVTKFDFINYLLNENRTIRRKALRHYKQKKSEALEPLYLLQKNMAETKTQIAKLEGFNDVQEANCITGLYYDKKNIYELYKLTKKYLPLKKRVHEIRRKILGYKKLGTEDMFIPLFKEKPITYDEGIRILENYLVNPTAKEWPKYLEYYNKLKNNINVSLKSDPKRSTGAWCEEISDGKNHSAIIYFDKFKGRLDDVNTIAHELNHGIHFQIILENGASINNTATPDYFYEAMAMQAEHRMYHNMLKDSKISKEQRISLLFSQVEDALSVFYGQLLYHFCELGFYDGRINNYQDFLIHSKILQKELSDPSVNYHDDIQSNLIFKVHNFDYSLYCINYVLADLMAVKLSVMPFNKVASLAKELTKQITKNDVEKTFKKYGIDITSNKWINEVFSIHKKRIINLESLLKN